METDTRKHVFGVSDQVQFMSKQQVTSPSSIPKLKSYDQGLISGLGGVFFVFNSSEHKIMNLEHDWQQNLQSRTLFLANLMKKYL